MRHALTLPLLAICATAAAADPVPLEQVYPLVREVVLAASVPAERFAAEFDRVLPGGRLTITAAVDDPVNVLNDPWFLNFRFDTAADGMVMCERRGVAWFDDTIPPATRWAGTKLTAMMFTGQPLPGDAAAMMACSAVLQVYPPDKASEAAQKDLLSQDFMRLHDQTDLAGQLATHSASPEGRQVLEGRLGRRIGGITLWSVATDRYHSGGQDYGDVTLAVTIEYLGA